MPQATLLPDNHSILYFGGLCKGKRFNDTHVFDVTTREWALREIEGTPPHPRSHHTATLVEFDEEEDGDAEKKIFIIGGYGGAGSTRDFTMDVHALDLDTWSWSKIERIKGPAPRPRADHAVCVAGNLLILTGGRGSATKGFSGYYDDVHVLDLTDQEWKRPPGYQPGDANEVKWATLPTPLWNHAACAIESVPSYKLFCFGGQKAEFVYNNTVSILDTARMVWSAPAIAGPPPGAREDCSVAYDTKTCNLLYFGGWRQGWLDDLWCLNVAGVVGPPYAVQTVEPSTGPVTGNTPVVLHGIGFTESSIVQVPRASTPPLHTGRHLPRASTPPLILHHVRLPLTRSLFCLSCRSSSPTASATRRFPESTSRRRRSRATRRPSRSSGRWTSWCASPSRATRTRSTRACSASTSTRRRRAAWPSARRCCPRCTWGAASR